MANETTIEIDVVPIAPVNEPKSGKPCLQIPKNDENFISEADGFYVSTDYASGSFECEVDLELLHLAQSKSYLLEIDQISMNSESIHSQRIMDAYVDVDIVTEPVKLSNSGCDQKKSPIKVETHDSNSSTPTPTATHLPTIRTIDGSFSAFMQELVKAKSNHNLPPIGDIGMAETLALIQKSLLPKKETIETVENQSPMVTTDSYEIVVTSFDNYEMENESITTNPIANQDSILSNRSETIISYVKASTSTTHTQSSTESNLLLSPTGDFIEIQKKYGHEKNW